MRKLYRCRWDKKLAGVCGGLGQYFQCDPTLIRLCVIILCVLTAIAPIAIIYIALAILLPWGPSTYVEIPCKKLYRSVKNRKLAGVCGGLGEYLRIDPTTIRIIYVVFAIVTCVIPALIIYVVSSIIIPEKIR